MNNKVFRIYLKEEENRMKLSEKVAEIRLTLTDERITEIIAGYTKQLLPYIYSMPEIIQLPIPAADVEPYISALVDNIAQADDINYAVLLRILKSIHVKAILSLYASIPKRV